MSRTNLNSLSDRLVLPAEYEWINEFSGSYINRVSPPYEEGIFMIRKSDGRHFLQTPAQEKSLYKLDWYLYGKYVMNFSEFVASNSAEMMARVKYNSR